MAEIVCPQCKATNKDTARFCSECGASLLGSTPLPFEEHTNEPCLRTGLLLQDRYRIVKELGRGGFGAVYRAWDTRLNKAVAVKENLETSPEAQRQFAREALVLASLSHPNLPRVTDHFSLPDRGQYLVMDFVEGDDLETLVCQKGVVSVEQALIWTLQVVDALEYLHRQDPPVFHRDIKPANVRITPQGKAMLVDFGLVKVSSPHLKTTMGARAISPGYAPPEQYGQGRTDARSDIYALAATLYRLVTDQVPPESVQRIGKDTLLPAEQVNPQVPAQVSQAIEQGMAMDPNRRYPNADEFEAALKQGMAAVRAARSSTSVVQPAPSFQARAAVGAPFSPVSGPSQGEEYLRTKVADTGVDQPLKTQMVNESPATPGHIPGMGDVVLPTTRVKDSTLEMAAVSDRLQPGKASPRWLVAGIGGIVLVILVVAVVTFFALSGGGASSKTATAEIENTMVARVQATQTRMVQGVANDRTTATAQAQDAAATETQILTVQFQASPTAYDCQTLLASQPLLGDQCWPILFQDAFDSDRNEWSTGKKVESWATYQVEVKGGDYRMNMRANDKGNYYIAWREIPTGEEFLLSTRTHLTGGSKDSWTGLIFRVQDSENFYLFTITDDGQYGFWSLKDNEWKNILPKAKTNAIQSNSWNELAVSGQGSLFKFFVNGALVGQASDTTFPSGEAGLYFEPGTDLTLEAEMDDLILYTPPQSSLQLSQTQPPQPPPPQVTSPPQDPSQATSQAVSSFLASLSVNATPNLKYGPESGSLPHDPSDGSLSYRCFSLNIRNFMLQVNFTAPYSSGSLAWDFGILFRVAANPNFRLILHGDTKWILENFKSASNEYASIADGKAPSLRSDQGDSNLVQVVVKDSQGWLLVNNVQSDKLDLSANSDSGDVCIAIGFYKNTEIAGKETRYSDFTVWELR